MNDVLVLCYHAVSDHWPDELAVRPDQLERQLWHLLDSDYGAATFSEAVTSPASERTVAITFDDGFTSVVELGLPILERLGVPATLFVPTQKVDAAEPMSWPGIDHWLSTPHRHELRGASWEQIAALAEAGWEIGSHTRTHPRLPELGDADLAEELSTSREEVEGRLGRSCPSIAYPYGAVDARVVAATGAAGYQTAAALPTRLPRRPDPMQWPRIMIRRSESVGDFRRHVSRPFRRLQSSSAWGAISRAVPAVRRAQGALRRRAPDGPDSDRPN